VSAKCFPSGANLEFAPAPQPPHCGLSLHDELVSRSPCALVFCSDCGAHFSYAGSPPAVTGLPAFTSCATGAMQASLIPHCHEPAATVAGDLLLSPCGRLRCGASRVALRLPFLRGGTFGFSTTTREVWGHVASHVMPLNQWSVLCVAFEPIRVRRQCLEPLRSPQFAFARLTRFQRSSNVQRDVDLRTRNGFLPAFPSSFSCRISSVLKTPPSRNPRLQRA